MVSDRVIQEKLKEAKNKYQEAVHHKGRATDAEGNTYSFNLVQHQHLQHCSPGLEGGGSGGHPPQ